MKLSITPANNQPLSPAFKSVKPKVKYFDIKNIPNVPCACCGKKVIVPAVIDKIYTSVSRPLASVLNDKTGSLNCWKKTEAMWNILQKLAQENPKKSFEKIIKDDKNRKLVSAAISIIVANDLKEGRGVNFETSKLSLFKDIVYKSRNKLRSSSVVMKKFAPLKSYLDGAKLQTFEQLEIYSRKYPRKSLTEIINIPEVYEFHRTKDLLQRAETKERIDFRFDNIKNMVKKVNPDAAEYFDSLKDEALEIFSTCTDTNMRMLKIKNLYHNALKNHNCEKLTKKVNNEIDKMPTTYISMDSFFVYARNNDYNDTNILSSIFGPVTSSFEHVVPRSKEGADDMSNGLVLHQTCNKARGNISYEEFFEYHPEMPKNILKQVNFIAKKILKGELGEEFRFYPTKISKTLFRYTNGIVNINLTKYCEKGLDLIEKRIQERNQMLEQLGKEAEAKKEQQIELQKKIAVLESEINGIDKTAEKLNQQNSSEKPLKKAFIGHIKLLNKSKQG